MHSSILIQRRAIKLAVLLAIQYTDNGISAFSPPSLPRTSQQQQLRLASVHRPSRSRSSSVHPSTSRLLQFQFELSSSLQSEIDNDESIPTSSISSITNASMDKMKELGNSLILQAALNCGATEPMVDIEWKAERIIVTVDVHKDEHYSSGDDEDAFLMEMGDYLDEELMDDEIEWNDDGEEDEVVYEDGEEGEFDEEEFDGDEEEFDPEALGLVPDDSSTDTPNPKKFDLTLIARSINELLAQDGEDTPQFTIAKLHEIEVTTPEFDNTLRGKVMFENYKGFDVSVEHWEEPKKKKKKTKKTKAQKEPVVSAGEANEEEEPLPVPKFTITEGKLVGRDYEKEVTLVNVKGRVVKIKNDKIECVRLPKAKTEKGVKRK